MTKTVTIRSRQWLKLYRYRFSESFRIKDMYNCSMVFETTGSLFLNLAQTLDFPLYTCFKIFLSYLNVKIDVSRVSCANTQAVNVTQWWLLGCWLLSTRLFMDHEVHGKLTVGCKVMSRGRYSDLI
jgi:hypothetical protein